MIRAVYLHGFASSPKSSKAQFFGCKLADAGASVHIPQLDGGDFENLTITGQLAVIDKTVGGQPAVLLGSSLGGFLAALYAARHPEIQRVVLMAPAFQFPSRFRQRYSPQDLELWERKGSVPVYHYGYKKECLLGYRLIEDAARYEDEPAFTQPALLFHGIHDPVVPCQVSEAFAARHPQVTLHRMESGHELTDVLEEMWALTLPFLG